MSRILVIDDEKSIRNTLREILEYEKYIVDDAADGATGLKLVNEHKYDAILCDIKMPNMDGISFLKAVKLMPAYKFTPVIMLTTVSADERKAEGRAAGARAWVNKPFQPQQLVDAVQRLCLP